MISLFKLLYADGWDIFYSKMDSTQKQRIWKKIQQLKTLERARHLKKGLPYFVVETSQYRIAFKEERKKRTIYFAGNHKQYAKWYKSQKQTLQ